MVKLASGLVLVLLAAGVSGCQLIGSEKASEANDSATNAPEVILAENVQPEAVEVKPNPKSVKVVAATPLTRPTDPDVRVKAVKKGRSNPFARLVPPATTKAEPIELDRGRNNASRNNASSNNASKGKKSGPLGTKSALSDKSSKKTTTASKPAQSNDLPRLENPADAKTNDIVLPPLPEPTLAKQVSVQGVMMLGGQPKAILKAPNENVNRTVQAGDYLANGQILVASIDMSNPQNPSVVLQESGRTVTVGVGTQPENATVSVGTQPETIATALPF